jgi:hypothetical protein
MHYMLKNYPPLKFWPHWIYEVFQFEPTQEFTLAAASALILRFLAVPRAVLPAAYSRSRCKRVYAVAVNCPRRYFRAQPSTVRPCGGSAGNRTQPRRRQ